MGDARGDFVLLFTLELQGQGMSSACDIPCLITRHEKHVQDIWAFVEAFLIHTKTCWKMLTNKHVPLQNSSSKDVPNRHTEPAQPHHVETRYVL